MTATLDPTTTARIKAATNKAAPSKDGVRPVTTRTSDQAALLRQEWADNARWSGIERSYTAQDVLRLRGTVVEEQTLARRGAERLWNALHTKTFTRALGALTGNQAVQMVRGGLDAIYLSGWQVAADANLAGQTYPDQSL